MEDAVRIPEEVQQEIRRTRHGKERPLYVIMIILGLFAMLVAMVFEEEIEEMFTDGFPLDSGGDITSLLLWIFSVFGGIGSILLIIVGVLIMVYNLYGDQLAYSVRVSETNFPEIYEKVQEYTRLLGLKKAPEVFVQQMDGALNAYTSWIPGRTFIQLNAEIVDIAYMEHRDFDTLFFVMAHEFGHIYLHHVQLQYILWSLLINFIPFVGGAVFGNMLSRAREYSADRVAQALTGGQNQLECMMLLGVGRHLYKYTDAEAYLADISRRPPLFGRLARFCINLLSGHPIMPLRVAAVLDPAKKSGRLLGTRVRAR